ncbi:MAG: ammonium transporter [Pseudomonadota bacterium]|nr:ammonium transporter [Pseudomonadota bacterium]
MKRAILALGLSGALLGSGLTWAEPEVVASSEAVVIAASDMEPLTATPMADEPVVDAVVIVTEEAPAEEAAAEEPVSDSGDTAWIIVATALVLLMTIPGLALFYAGMVRRKNVLGTMMHSFATVALVSVLWVVAGYSLAFADGNWFVGGLDKMMLNGVLVGSVSGTIPESLFMLFQMTFAIITVAIISGSVAERMKFSSYLTFAGIWVLAVYAPICHWVWGGGWLFNDGALDFAGGTVVHINAGVAGLVAAYMIGNRTGLGREPMAPHNLVLTVIGASLLWVGWFGFNGGSALSAGGTAAMAMVVTQIAAAAGALAWMAAERVARGKASVLGGASGAIAGLVGITPAAGFVDVSGALAIGVLCGVVCFWAATTLKRMLKADDSLDAFGLHGVGGIIGALLTGVFVSEAIAPSAATAMPFMSQMWVQLEGVLATIAYSGIMTFIILKVIDLVMGLRVSEEEEREGLDVSQHGERVE